MKETASSCLVTRPNTSVLGPGLTGKLQMRFLGTVEKEKDGRVGKTSLCSINGWSDGSYSSFRRTRI